MNLWQNQKYKYICYFWSFHKTKIFKKLIGSISVIHSVLMELLNPKIIVERFVSEAPDDLLIAPRWGLKNFEFTAKLEKLLEERDTWQGRLFR